VRGGAIHCSAPRPEIVSAGNARFGPSSYQPLEGVRVSIDEPGKQGPAGQIDKRVGLNRIPGERKDAAVLSGKEACVPNKLAIHIEKIGAIERVHRTAS
jgi:hypothetical protein